MILSGLFNIKINGVLYTAKGSFTYNHGGIKNEAQLASNGSIAGFKTSRIIPFIEGEIIDTKDLDVKALKNTIDAEITLELANGKVFVLMGACWAGDGNIGTEDANLAVRFEGTDSDEFTL